MNKKVLFVTVLSVFALFSGFTVPKVAGQASVQARVIVEALNVRATPGLNGAVLGVFSQDMQLNVTGREDVANNGGIWVFATPRDGGLSGWVLAEYLAFPFGFDLNALPLMDAGSASVSPLSGETPQPAAPTGSPVGVTGGLVNLRTGPSLTASVLQVLPARSQVTLTGRDANSAWFEVQAGAQSGWVFAALVRVTGDISTLPVIETPVAASPATGIQNPTLSSRTVVSGIGTRTRQIYLQGQRLGNRRDVFSKVGDSITAWRYFLYPVGVGGLQLHDYAYLQPTVDFYLQTPARDHNSFANSSLAMREGWTSSDVLNPANSPVGICAWGETPLACEYRLSKPAVALIMIGTNDLFATDSAFYQSNLETIVQISLDMGVIPVLSTLPDFVLNGAPYGRVYEFNSIIRATAGKFGVPLWDYWAAMQSLPNYGMGGDGLHPSIPFTTETGIFAADYLQYGFNLRNLTALMVLDTLRKNVLY